MTTAPKISAALSLSAALGLAASLPLSEQEMESFLKSAAIVNRRTLSIGVTNSERATLSNGSLQHDAHIQTIDESRSSFQTVMGNEINFRDSYKYNIAAWRLDRMLGLGMVPVSVERKVGGKTGAVTWWVDDVQMMELDRHKKKLEPPDKEDWNDQMFQVRVFNELVYNTDANLGNILITKDWKIRLVDFTRAFRLYRTLREPKNLARIDRRLYQNLKALDQPTLETDLRPYLTEPEIQGLLARRDRIVAFFDAEIARRGEAAVFCGSPAQ